MKKAYGFREKKKPKGKKNQNKNQGQRHKTGKIQETQGQYVFKYKIVPVISAHFDIQGPKGPLWIGVIKKWL